MSRVLLLTVGCLLVFGTVFRLWPVFAGYPAVAEFFMTEDGYLLLTVARNMALGLGMSVSEGTIATNGVQPLQTFIFTLPYLVTGGGKIDSLIWVHVIHTLTALACVFAVRAFAAQVLAPRDPEPVWAWAVAILWFLGLLLVRHSMNGLETGLYTLVVLITLLGFARVLAAGQSNTLKERLGLGALCGLAVLARNDAVFLVTAIFLVWTVWELFVLRSGLRFMLARLVPPGLLSLLVAAPWLINNYIHFGSIVPISGTAQSLAATFGQNLPLVPVMLFEHAFPMLPVPTSMEGSSGVIGICVAGLSLVFGFGIWRVLRHSTPAARGIVLAFFLFGMALVTYYGLWFGAPHFLSRYFAPLAPLFILFSLVAALEVGRFIRRPLWLGGAYVGIGLLLSLGLLGRSLLPGVVDQGHSQVVAWVNENVPETTWVGAVQTGTLGYWHDRTINLDGKVNPAALEARAERGHVLDYIVGSDIDYVADWSGITGWPTAPGAEGGFGVAFEVVVKDEVANLGVLRRREASALAPLD